MSKHAYCIIAHSNPKQLAILLSLLDDSRNDIYIHIDRKSDTTEFMEQINTLELKCSVIFVTHRIRVYWGHYSQIVCELNLLEEVVRSGIPYDYIHLLSGADMPLATQDEIHDFFRKHKGEEFIHFNHVEYSKEDIRRKTEYPYYFLKYTTQNGWFARYVGIPAYKLARHFVIFFRLRSKYKIPLKKGSNWFSITLPMAKWIITHRKEIIKTLRHVKCCDEMMLQSFCPLSPYAAKISPLGHLRKIDWTRGRPYTWQATDFDELMDSGALFARKFSLDSHPEIIHKISDALLSRKLAADSPKNR